MKTRKFILPVLAAMVAIGAAFATNEKTEKKPESKPALVTYYVVPEEEDENSFRVTTEQDPNCGQNGARVCEISSTSAPDANNRILKSQASPSGWKP